MDHAEFQAASDDEAMEIIRASAEELRFQVWCGARLVGHLDSGCRFDKAALLAPTSIEVGE